jgi:hypothetical protein
MRIFLQTHWTRFAGGLLFVFIALTLFAIAMSRGLSRDEHQFVAAGAVLAQHGLLPYRDYPYFHVPNLVFVYALLFRCSSYLLLTSRSFSVVCSLLLLLIIYLFTAGRLEHLSRGKRFGIAAAVTICAFADPLFRSTYWRGWNHAFPILLITLAFLCYLPSRVRDKAGCWLFATGLLTGLAAGSRSTFAPAALAFLLALFFSDLGRAVWRRTAWFCAGTTLGVLPTLILFSLFPKQFVFGNLTYNDRLYPMLCSANALEYQMPPPYKLLYFITHILAQPGNAALTVGLAYFLFRSRGWRETLQRPSLLLPLLVCFLFLGALIPAIPLPQYFYAPMPLVVIGLTIAISRTRSMLIPDYLMLGLVVAVCAVSTAIDYRYLLRLGHPDQWATIKVHRVGCQLAAATRGGCILSLAPIFPLEGSVNIYPQLTAEPFACRGALFMPPFERTEQKMLAPDDLARLAVKEPPQAILVGSEPLLEHAITNFAKASGYRPVSIDLGLTLFLPPVRHRHSISEFDGLLSELWYERLSHR